MGRNVHQLQEDLTALLESGSLSILDGCSKAGACLPPLLDGLGWRGEARHLVESLPHFDEVSVIDDLRAVLARLNYECQPSEAEPAQISPQQLPCLLVTARGDIKVLLSRKDNTVSLFDGETGNYAEQPAPALTGTVYLVRETNPEEAHENVVRYGWMPILVGRFRGLFVQLLVLTFVSNLFALAVPVYVMNVYDKVIGTRSTDTLVYFLIGIGIVIGADMVIKAIRARGLAYLGARFDTLIGAAAFQQLLHLPVSMTERSPIGSQITRLKQFDGIRDIFTGSVASAVLDMPFAIIFIGTILMIGGVIAAVPVALIVIYAIMAAITIPLTNLQIKATGAARSKMQNFIIELVSKQRDISDAHAQAVWLDRYRKLSEETSRHHFRSQQLNMKIQTVTQSLVMVAGVATLAIGTMMVMNDAMTIGVLIAVMALVWKVLSPIQSIFLSLNRVTQAVQSFRQVNYLMRMKPERLPGLVPSFYRRFVGAITLNRVSFRYGARAEPALMGVSLDIPAGQIVAIAGASGAGKSTLLRIIAGLYLPQAGSVQVDGLDIRQLDMGELRHAISYVPQNVTLFHGTVAQNVRLAQPTATFEQVRTAAMDATLYDYCDCLPDRLETRLTAELRSQLPAGLKQRIMLARAYVKDAPIYLLDEPANNLDNAGDAALVKKLEALRGNATVLMITHRPSHMKLADRLIFMEQGQIVHDGTPEQVLPLIFPS